MTVVHAEPLAHLGASYVESRTPEAKMIRTYEGSVNDPVAPELFGLDADLGETENLYQTADRRTQVVGVRASDGGLRGL